MIVDAASVPHLKTVVGSDTDFEWNSFFLSKFKLYETKTSFYLIGTDKTRTLWKILKIDRSRTAELDIFEDPSIYNRNDCNELLNRLDAGNQSTGGLKFVTKAYGVVGFIKFLEPYYMILVTKRQPLGNICGHSIYGIGESRLLAIPHVSFQTNVAASQAEHRYKKLFSSIDLTRDFFFSYTYKIMWSLQKNVLMDKGEKMPYDDMFVWNSFLTHEYYQQISSLQWTVALIHGYFKQAILSTCGTATYKATLIARRSRHFAGTRYLKRGVNEKGWVANDVETEQLINGEPWEEFGQISSVVQHRGSIPLFWSQETSILSPKPDIKLERFDSGYKATRLHFENLAARYGKPIIVLNLVKTMEKRPRETVLCREFANAVAQLNASLPKEKHIKFVQWDLHKFSKSGSTNVLEVLGTIVSHALSQVGFYLSNKPSYLKCNEKEHLLELVSKKQENLIEMEFKEEEKCQNQEGVKSRFQCGVLRTNCIDCLDRTNVAQYAFGITALCQQIHGLGLSDAADVSADSNVGSVLMDMYEDMGDVLAVQYGGSTAHNTVLSSRQGKWKAATQSLDLLRSIRRHYTNAYIDGGKQDAINIFLGHFQPELGRPPLWQLDFNNHLQIRRGGHNPFSDFKFKRSFSAGSMLEQNTADTLSLGRLKHPSMDTILHTNNVRDGTTDLFREDFAISDSFEMSDASLKNTINGRCLITSSAHDFQHCSVPLPSTIKEGEVDQSCFQQYEGSPVGGILNRNPNWNRQLPHTSVCAEELISDESDQVGSNLERKGANKARALHYSESFSNWIHGDHAFFH